ncbi:MAG: type VI secretion system contractile sheath large subunit [Planctomycetota bacterium]
MQPQPPQSRAADDRTSTADPPLSVDQSLLSSIVAATTSGATAAGLTTSDSTTAAQPAAIAGRWRRFREAPDAATAILAWLGGPFRGSRDDLARRLNNHVAYIDRLLNAQLNEVLHAPPFQKLEASWRGLAYLVEQADREDDPMIKIRVLNASWRDLERDSDRAVEFDQSQLFRKVYESEFGMPGGEPFGLLIGDYEVQPRPSSAHPHDDLRVVESIMGVAAAAFCPVVLNAHPAMFGLDDFTRLEQRLDHERTFNGVDYVKWNALRAKQDARFLGITLPRVLMRTPYEDDGDRVDRFRFHEDVRGPDRSKYLWGGAGYAFGSVLMRAFAQAGWLADIRGARRGLEGGGLVTGLPTHGFATDQNGYVNRSSTDVIITEDLEKQLSDLGFMPLCFSKDTEYSVFYSNQSLQKPQRFDRPAASVNAQISAMLQYMLCVSRFAHYIKVLGRDKLGALATYEELESFLRNWIVRYVTSDSEASPDTKARYPLRDADVRVEPTPGKAGSYQCLMRLMPHYELDELQASVRVVAELSPRQGESA